MMKTVHFRSNRSYGLSRAILVYSDGQESFATIHEPKNSPDGGPPYLDAGEPLTTDFLRELAKRLGQTVAREVLPPNVLVHTPEMLVWWTKQQRRVMFYSDSCDGRTLSGHSFPQPALVFRVCGSELALRVGREQKAQIRHRSDVRSVLNCDGAGRVCQGSMRSPGKLCFEAMTVWERAFFESEFTHAAIGARPTAHPEGFLGLWRDLTGSETGFPAEFLVKSGETLGAFVQGRED